MKKIKIKQIKLSEMIALQNYLTPGMEADISTMHNPEKSAVLAIIGEICLRIMQKTYIADKNQTFSLKLTVAEAFAFIAYTRYNISEINNEYASISINAFKDNIVKQLY